MPSSKRTVTSQEVALDILLPTCRHGATDRAYYGKEPMTNLDKALFTFAAYNAGAGRISSLRKEATKPRT